MQKLTNNATFIHVFDAVTSCLISRCYELADFLFVIRAKYLEPIHDDIAPGAAVALEEEILGGWDEPSI